jgi:hypothetical protein
VGREEEPLAEGPALGVAEHGRELADAVGAARRVAGEQDRPGVRGPLLGPGRAQVDEHEHPRRQVPDGHQERHGLGAQSAGQSDEVLGRVAGAEAMAVASDASDTRITRASRPAFRNFGRGAGYAAWLRPQHQLCLVDAVLSRGVHSGE